LFFKVITHSGKIRAYGAGGQSSQISGAGHFPDAITRRKNVQKS
jgi:hypothetical protein